MIKFIIGLSTLFVIVGCGGPSVDRSDSLVVIDAGHGGHDSGATCAGKQEKDIVLGITKKLYKEFKNEGYKVYMTRNRDRFLTLGQRTRLQIRKMLQCLSQSMQMPLVIEVVLISLRVLRPTIYKKQEMRSLNVSQLEKMHRY